MPSHLSYSQISLYLECPLRYKLVYLEGLQGDGVPAALVFGRAIHTALAGFYRNVMDREPFELAGFLQAFADAWEGEVEGKEVIYREGEDFVTLLELGRTMLRAFARSATPQTIIGVELPFEFRLEHPFTGKDSSIPIRGVIDLVEEDEAGTLWVVDHKTAARAYSQNQVAGDLQLLIYAAAVRQLDVVEGRDVLLRLDVLLKGKKPRMERYCTERTMEDVARLFEIVEGVWTAIEAEAFYPRCCVSTRFGMVHEECVRKQAQ
ncbi:MAG: PD-(D/E)XK nuclease family protein [Dehalococcoidia bacterium]|nr:PD-(D/E)XK nuclease family protein [Dehalococcoidia bacterium]